MKTKILFILTIACFRLSFGQTYYPLVDNNEKIWKGVSETAADTTSYTIDSLQFVSDTLINSKVYKKTLAYNKRYNSHYPNIGWTYYYDYIFLREDSTKKVFALYPNESEKLLYNFNLNVNDTFYAYPYSADSNCYYIVHQIDSVIIGSDYRKRITFYFQNFPYFTDTWIEGIGTITYELLCPCCYGCMTGSTSKFVCYYENNVLLYNNLNPPYNNCLITAINSLKDDLFYVSFNNNVLNIVTQNHLYKLNIYNILINKLSEYEFYGSLELDLKKFTKGIYIYSIEDEYGNKLYVNKVLIN